MNQYSQQQSGSMIFVILIAVAMLAALTYTVMNNNSQSGDITDEKLIIYSTEIEQYGSELTQAVQIILDNGMSESDISFAHANAPSSYGDETSIPTTHQIFSVDGGQAGYRTPNADISSANHWEFYGESAMPYVGSERADLIAVLPNVTQTFCDVFNKRQDLENSGTYPTDTGTCFKANNSERFDGDFNDTPNTLSLTNFPDTPTFQACVQCGSEYHIYSVIYSR